MNACLAAPTVVRVKGAYDAAGTALEAHDPPAALCFLAAADAALTERPDRVDATNVELLRGRAHCLNQDPDAACASALRAIELARALPPGERERPLVQALCDAADFERECGRPAAGTPKLYEAVELAVSALGACDPDTASAWNSLGLCRRYLGDFDGAGDAYRRALGACSQGRDIKGQAAVLHNIASLEQLAGNPATALTTIGQAMAHRHTGDPDRTGDVGVMAAVLADLGRYDDAAAAYQLVCDSLGSKPCPAEAAHLHANRAVLAHLRGNLGEAQMRYSVAVTEAERVFGPSHFHVGAMLANAALLAADQGRADRARTTAGRAVQVLEGNVSEEFPSLQLARAVVGQDE
jgi:tetratricopeptide (TPR) repeat protein